MEKKSWVLNRNLNKKGDVLVSAVLYFGLGIVVLTLVLSLGMPAVNRLRDKNVATQTKDVFATLDANIRQVARGGPGTQRVLELGLSKGEVKVYSASNAEKAIDSTAGANAKKVIFGDTLIDIPNRVVWTYQLKAALTEPDLQVTEGNTKILTTGSKGTYNVRFWLDYEPTKIMYLRMGGANIISGNTKISIKNMGSQCINLKDSAKPTDGYGPAGTGTDEGKCTQDSELSAMYPDYKNPRITILIQAIQ